MSKTDTLFLKRNITTNKLIRNMLNFPKPNILHKFSIYFFRFSHQILFHQIIKINNNLKLIIILKCSLVLLICRRNITKVRRRNNNKKEDNNYYYIKRWSWILNWLNNAKKLIKILWDIITDIDITIYMQNKNKLII